MTTMTIAALRRNIAQVAPEGTSIGKASRDANSGDIVITIDESTLEFSPWAEGTITMHFAPGTIDSDRWYIDELPAWDERHFRRMMRAYFKDGFERAVRVGE